MKNKLLIALNIFVLVIITAGIRQVLPGIREYFQSGKIIAIDYSVSSLLGNKNFFAETLFLTFPFILISLLYLNRFWKYVSIFNLISVILYVFLLRTLSVWLAFAVCFLIGIFLLSIFRRNFFSHGSQIRKKAIPVILAGGIIIIAAGIFTANKTGGLSTINSKFANAIKYLMTDDSLSNDTFINSNSIYERLILWRNSLRMIKENPLTGVGISDWKIDFPHYGSAGADIFNSVNIRFQHPHNDYLFIAAESGIIASLFYVLFFVTAIYFSIRKIKRSEDNVQRIEFFLMCLGIIGFLIISLFSMPLMRYYPVILVLVMVAFVFTDYDKRMMKKNFILIENEAGLIFFTGFILCIVAINVGIKRMNSDFHLADALNAQRGGNFGRMARELNAINNFIYPVDNFGSPVVWYKGIAAFYKGEQKKAFSFFIEAERINPYHFHLLNDLGSCYNLTGNSSIAKEYYRRTLALAPQYADAIVNLSIVYYNERNLDSAYAIVTRVRKPGTEKSIQLLQAILEEKKPPNN